MPSKIGYLKYLFLILLLVGSTLIMGYDFLYGIPKRKCDAAGDWWSWGNRKCYAPIYLPTLTHRMPGQPTAADKSQQSLDWHDKPNDGDTASPPAK